MTSRRMSLRHSRELASRAARAVENLSCGGNGTRSVPATIRRAAFTLVELLVVLVIAVILMAVTLPTVKYSLEEGKLREGARQFNAFCATAKARAAVTGRPSGVWLEFTELGDPNTPFAQKLYQCSQLYLAEIPPPYGGDVLNARCFVTIPALPGTPNNSELNHWLLQVLDSSGNARPFLVTNPSAATLFTGVNQNFWIRFDFKGNLYGGETLDVPSFDDDGDGNTDEQGEFGFYVYGRGGADARYGRANVDDNGNGSVDADMNGPDRGEYGNGDDVRVLPPTAANASGGYAFQIYRTPQRIGQPLELPQGIVIDPNYSGLGPAGMQCSNAARQMLIQFSPQGGVGKVMWTNRNNGTLVEDFESSKIHFLIGKTEKVEVPWNTTTREMKDHNIADGSNLWVSINRRTGSVGTVENVPNPNLPFTTVAQRAAFIAAAREFATGGEVKGGQ